MSQAIIDALIAKKEAISVSSASLHDHAADGDDRILALFFTGDLEKKPETADVAVALRELGRQYRDDLKLAVVERDSEADLMETCAVTTLPSIAFMAGQRHIETIARIQNWATYAERLPKILAAAGRAAPV